MAGASQLIARLQARPVSPVTPPNIQAQAEYLKRPGNRDSHQLALASALEPIEQFHIVHTAATACPEWVEARDAFHHHLFGCRGCHAPTGRYCQAGAELRTSYDATPWRSIQATRVR